MGTDGLTLPFNDAVPVIVKLYEAGLITATEAVHILTGRG